MILPLPPNAEREALPDFRARLEDGELGVLDGYDVVMDELEMVERKRSNDDDDDDERHNLLRIQIGCKHS